MNLDRATLDRLLIAAHEQDDSAALVQLYTEAADQAETAGDVQATCFYLTHAFVFALQSGDRAADPLNLRLFNYGRELRQTF
jgi:hypothetical protein